MAAMALLLIMLFAVLSMLFLREIWDTTDKAACQCFEGRLFLLPWKKVRHEQGPWRPRLAVKEGLMNDVAPLS